MTVTDKARDIAVLLSMGARREQIRRIFLFQGLAIGASGTVLGLVTGYAFAWIAGTYQLIPSIRRSTRCRTCHFTLTFWMGCGLGLRP